MSLEIEIEFLVPNLTTIEILLKKINAELKEKTIYRDIYFNKKEFYNNNRIRLRKIERTYPSKNSSSLFTKKSPKIENGIQISEEKETQPKSFDWAYTKLETKYGSPIMDAKLEITNYIFDGATISLRNIKNFFKYVEIEAENKEKINDIITKLKIKPKTLKEGALNKVLEMKGLPKIKV